MKPSELIQVIRQYCIKNANPDLLKKYQYYFKEGYDGYGLTSPMLKQKVKEILGPKTMDINIVLDAMPQFLASRKYEEITMGLLIMDGLHKQYNVETFRQIETFFSQGIDNWAHADTLGMFMLPKFLIKDIVDISAFKPWLKSQYKFQRRCVPVTFIKLETQTKNCTKYISFCEKLMFDKEREVHQGMGWFLRECWKLQPAEVETFLEKHKETAPRLIIQYACEKMKPEEKLRYKRTKQPASK